MSYSYPAAGSPRPHAPTSVGGNSNGYDANGNLTSAEGRTYEYDLENRLWKVNEATTLQEYAYDGDGTLRKIIESGVTTHHVTADYEVNASTGEITLRYSFGGRAVAFAKGANFRYLLGDHLGSSHAEAQSNQAEAGQRRFTPFGSDRPVSGANDLLTEDRFTGQHRLDNGNGNSRRELYHYGARAYLPGVGIFTQPDSAAQVDIGTSDVCSALSVGYGDPTSLIRLNSAQIGAGTHADRSQDRVPTDPQLLNRYSYARNNPLTYLDPDGHLVFLAVPAAVYGYMALGVVATAVVVWWSMPRNEVREAVTDSVTEVLDGLANPVQFGENYSLFDVHVGGYKIRFHENDHGDSIGGELHGHIIDGQHSGKKVSVATGVIYDPKRRQVLGKLNNKELQRLQDEVNKNIEKRRARGNERRPEGTPTPEPQPQ